MGWETGLAYLAAFASGALALFALWRDPRKVANQALAGGLFVLAFREAATGVATAALFQVDIAHWHRMRLAGESLVPGCWILFTLTFARANYDKFLTRWRWLVVAAFATPAGLVAFGWASLLNHSSTLPTPSGLIPLGDAGYALQAVLLVSAVLIFMNLEGTLRASTGTVRWQIKFTLIGVGTLFGVQVFLSSQALLYASLQTHLFPVGAGALLVACFLFVVSFVRRRLGNVDLYPSEALLHRSLTLLIVGTYLVVVAGLVEAMDAFAGDQRGTLVAFVVMVALLGLAAALLSVELRQRVKRFVNRHLQRPAYDYREVWNSFSRSTSAAVESESLCAAICKLASETFDCRSATLWLLPKGEDRLTWGGSTAVSREQGARLLANHGDGRPLLDAFKGTNRAIDLRGSADGQPARSLYELAKIRYGVPLLDGSEQCVGFLTLNDSDTGRAFSVEDFELLETFGAHTAAALVNRRLTDELQRAREMETFQALSAFFVHDLKNLASRLSLVMQNLPAHYDKAEFREDLLKTMSTSVRKIETMTNRLGSLTKGLDLSSVDTDVNLLVGEILTSLNGTMTSQLTRQLGDLPLARLDPDLIQKVLTNLVLNAQEASGGTDSIQIATASQDGWIRLSVSDHGCGMSPEFISKSLFKPFQTTKKQGLGIGLFHSKQIVEAHGGRIEVNSELGTGTTFHVLLPVSSLGDTPTP